MSCECSPPEWISHGGWLRCRRCGSDMERYESVADCIQKTRDRLEARKRHPTARRPKEDPHEQP